MSDTQNSPEKPETPEPLPAAGVGGSPEEALETDVTSDSVTVRRAPRYGRFITVGAIVGAVVALILTFVFPENEEFDRGQVFGFLVIACAAIGVALGALVALLLDRASARRTTPAIVEHESTHRVDE